MPRVGDQRRRADPSADGEPVAGHGQSSPALGFRGLSFPGWAFPGAGGFRPPAGPLVGAAPRGHLSSYAPAGCRSPGAALTVPGSWVVVLLGPGEAPGKLIQVAGA